MVGPHTPSKAAPDLRNSCRITVAFADKSPVVLAGLKSLVLQDARSSLVVTACDGERFLDGARRLVLSPTISTSRTMHRRSSWRSPT